MEMNPSLMIFHSHVYYLKGPKVLERMKIYPNNSWFIKPIVSSSFNHQSWMDERLKSSKYQRINEGE